MIERRNYATGWRLAGFWIGALGASACLMTALFLGVGAVVAAVLI